MDFVWGYDVVHNYLLTGRFTWYVPTLSALSSKFVSHQRCRREWE